MKNRQDDGSTRRSARIGARFRKGDPRAAEEVRDRVRRTLSFGRYGIPPQDRQDLEQIVMAQLWEAVERPEFDTAGGFWGFVEVVVARRSIDWLRTRRDEIPLDAGPVGADPADSPLDTALLHERRELVRGAVERLPASCRDLIRLHLEGRRTYAEMAELLGASEGALRVRMHRCVERARRVLLEVSEAKKSTAEM